MYNELIIHNGELCYDDDEKSKLSDYVNSLCKIKNCGNCDECYDIGCEVMNLYGTIINQYEQIQKLKLESERTRWHSVAEEGLPKKEGRYRVTDDRGQAFELNFYHNALTNKVESQTNYDKYIVAWAELQQPYKGE